MIEFEEDDINEIIKKCNETSFKLNTLDNNFMYKLYKIKPYFKLFDIEIKYKIIRKKFNNNSNIPLIVSVGVSNESLCNNLIILDSNINKINNKYSEIIFIFIEDGKNVHESYVKKYKEENSNENNLFVINDIMKKEIANHYDKIIRKINEDYNYNYVDYLGVSFSGGVGCFLVQINNKINNLILMAPAIYEGFTNINKNQSIILCWCIQDKIVEYEKDGKRLINEIKEFNNKIILLIDLDKETNNRTTHRLQHNLFDIINLL